MYPVRLTTCIRNLGPVFVLVMIPLSTACAQSAAFPGRDAYYAVEPWPFAPGARRSAEMRDTERADVFEHETGGSGNGTSGQAGLRQMPGYSKPLRLERPGGSRPFDLCFHGRQTAGCGACRNPAPVGAPDVWVPDERYPGFAADGVVEHIPAPIEEFAQPLSLKSDLAVAWYRLRDDTFAVYRPENLTPLAIAGGTSLGIREQLDGDVRRDTAMHPERWGVASDFFGVLGAAEYQVPVLLSVYAWSLHEQNHELHDFSATLTSAFTINGLSTLLLKGITDTERPTSNFNGGRWGFPSYHASSSFAIAGVLDEYFGHRTGVPAYVVAGLIGWSRIDERDHDLSDVVFGSVMGLVIGKAVARHELTGDSRVRLVPWIPPFGSGGGLSLQVRY